MKFLRENPYRDFQSSFAEEFSSFWNCSLTSRDLDLPEDLSPQLNETMDSVGIPFAAL